MHLFKNGENSIHYCCRNNNVDAARQIIDYLISNGVSLNVQNKNGESALHIAARYGSAEIVKYLCENGANVDLLDDVRILTTNGFMHVIIFE